MPLVKWRGSTALNEAPVSPEWTYGDRITCVRILRGPYALAKSSAPLKGAFGSGEVAGMRVEESKVTKEKGAIGTLTIRYEWGGGDPMQGTQLPPDEGGIKLEKTERALEKHPRYVALDDVMRGHIKTLLEKDSQDPEAQTQVFGNALATELYGKLLRGDTHYPFYAPVYRILTYSWLSPGGLSKGGFRDIPPVVPVNPPSGTDWIREGDSVDWNGTHWIKEQRWLGGPDLDTDIFP